jgi:alpha-1,2-mannosyltransferase
MAWTRARGWACAAAIVAGVCVYYALTWKSFSAFSLAIDRCQLVFCDFQGHYYPMGQVIFQRNIPVAGFFYSPFFAILLAVFKPLALEPALVVWGGFQLLLAALLALAPRMFGIRSIPASLASLFLVLTAFPVIHNFKWGQVSVLIVLCLLAAFHLYERGRTTSAAFLFAFTISVKFFPAWFLVYFVLRRDWRFVLKCAGASLLLLVVVPAIALGPGDTLRFYKVLHAFLGLAKGHLLDANSQYFSNVVRRLGVAAAYDGTVPYHDMLERSLRFEVLLRGVGWLLAAAIAVLLYRVVRRSVPPGEPGMKASAWAFVLLSLALPFAVYTSWPHYFAYLPFCQVFLWREIARSAAGVRRRTAKLGLLVLPSVAASSVILYNILRHSHLNLGRSIPSREIYPFWGFLFFADALLCLAAWIELRGMLGRTRAIEGGPPGTVME